MARARRVVHGHPWVRGRPQQSRRVGRDGRARGQHGSLPRRSSARTTRSARATRSSCGRAPPPRGHPREGQRDDRRQGPRHAARPDDRRGLRRRRRRPLDLGDVALVAAVHGPPARAPSDERAADAEFFREASASSVLPRLRGRRRGNGWRLSVESPAQARLREAPAPPRSVPDTGFHDELVPFEHLPRVLNPEEGFVATANNAPGEAGDPYFGSDFLDGYRVSAIVDMLRAKRDWDVGSTIEAQRDVRSIPWEEMQGAVLSTACADADGALARVTSCRRGTGGWRRTRSARASTRSSPPTSRRSSSSASRRTRRSARSATGSTRCSRTTR